MSRLSDERGQVVVLSALCMVVLLGFVAFAVDVGLLLRSKRVEQTAADSAAIAAAAEFNYGDMTAAADADAAQNGVPASAVKVNNPPTLGPHAGNSNYVEVLIAQSQPVVFMKMFSRIAMTVGARAVATTVPTTTCIDTLSSATPNTSDSPPGGVYVTGSADLELPSCGILDNATGAFAVHVTGGATLRTTSLGIVGTDTVHNGGVLQPSSPVTGMTPVSDPLGSIVTLPPASDYSSGCQTDPNIKTGTPTIGPATPTGYVCYNGLTISRSPTVTLNPGLYIINGSNALSISGAATVNGIGVTFYFVNGASFSISNGSIVNLTAPTSGAYSGILFEQNSLDTAADSFQGDTSGGLRGIFYLPTANLSLGNSTSTTVSADLVVGSLTMSGNVTLNPYTPLSGASPLSNPRLAE